MPALIILAAIIVVCFLLLGNKGTRGFAVSEGPPVESLNLRSLKQALQDSSSEEAIFAVALLKDQPHLSIENIRRFIIKKWHKSEMVDILPANGMERSIASKDALMSFELIQPLNDNDNLDQALMDNDIWPEARKEVEGHCAALLIKVRTDQCSLAEHSIVLSKTVAALCSTCHQVLGIWWTPASQVFSRQAAIDQMAVDYEQAIPLNLWVASKTFRDDHNQINGYTKGLRFFGGEEFEAFDVPESQGELLKRLYGLVAYSLTSGKTIQNGNTLGQDHNEKIQVKKKPSKTSNGGWVFQLDYQSESAAKPWKK